MTYRPLFSDSALFRQTSSEAQKEFSTDVKTPCLTWHMSFLITKEYTERKMRRRLDRIICCLIRSIRKGNAKRRLRPSSVTIFPSIGDRSILFSSARDGRLKRVSRNKCTSRELHVLDATNRLIIFTFSQAATKYTVRVRLTVDSFTVTVLAQVPDKIVRNRPPAQKNDFCLKNFDSLTLRFWEQKYTLGYMFRLGGTRHLFRSRAFDGIFADIRGVIISEETVWFENENFRAGDKEPDWANGLLKTLRPIVTLNDYYECTASYMLDGRALYLTAFGPQPLDYAEHKRRPSTFIVCVQSKHVSIQQLGHLVDRMQLIGTLRHAALIDLDLLRTASEQLSRLDVKTKQARDAIDLYDRDRSSSLTVSLALEDARNELSSITNDFLRQSPAGIGLSFRIENARYFVSQFEKNLPALRLGRVEGYRRYDHFVYRRLGGAFEFIDRLGYRYARATAVLAEINVSFSSVQARKTGEQARQTAVQSSKTQELVAEIQRYGELFLLVFLVPYYLMNSLEHLTKLREPEEIITTILIIFAVIMLACNKYIDGSVRMDFKEKQNRKRFIFSTAVLVSFLSIIALIYKQPIWIRIVAAIFALWYLFISARRIEPPHKEDFIPPGKEHIIFRLMMVAALLCFLAVVLARAFLAGWQ